MISFDSNKLKEATIKLKVNSVEVPEDITNKLFEATVTEQLNPPAGFSLVFFDPGLTLVDHQKSCFTEGSIVEISLGYGNEIQRIIKGEISIITLEIPENGVAIFRVEGFDLSHRLTRGTVYRIFEESSDSDIVVKIAKEANLRASVEPTPHVKLPRVQDHITNFAFVEELAELNNYCTWMEEDTLHFKPNKPDVNLIELELGKNLLSFTRRVSTVGLVNDIIVRGWDVMKNESYKAVINASGAISSELAQTGIQQVKLGAGDKSQIVVTNTKLSSSDENEKYGKKILSGLLDQILAASGSSVGNPKIRAGTVLDIKNLSRFSGKYIVNKVTHSLSQEGYRTLFEMGKKE
ncbi:MAG: hypothetical protein N2645_14075 [Clostridia bacterium]|nr:hypothetical protein [Clostridia bacterium]